VAVVIGQNADYFMFKSIQSLLSTDGKKTKYRNRRGPQGPRGKRGPRGFPGPPGSVGAAGTEILKSCSGVTYHGYCYKLVLKALTGNESTGKQWCADQSTYRGGELIDIENEEHYNAFTLIFKRNGLVTMMYRHWTTLTSGLLQHIEMDQFETQADTKHT